MTRLDSAQGEGAAHGGGGTPQQLKAEAKAEVGAYAQPADISGLSTEQLTNLPVATAFPVATAVSTSPPMVLKQLTPLKIVYKEAKAILAAVSKIAPFPAFNLMKSFRQEAESRRQKVSSALSGLATLLANSAVSESFSTAAKAEHDRLVAHSQTDFVQQVLDQYGFDRAWFDRTRAHWEPKEPGIAYHRIARPDQDAYIRGLGKKRHSNVDIVELLVHYRWVVEHQTGVCSDLSNAAALIALADTLTTSTVNFVAGGNFNHAFLVLGDMPVPAHGLSLSLADLTGCVIVCPWLDRVFLPSEAHLHWGDIFVDMSYVHQGPGFDAFDPRDVKTFMLAARYRRTYTPDEVTCAIAGKAKEIHDGVVLRRGKAGVTDGEADLLEVEDERDDSNFIPGMEACVDALEAYSRNYPGYYPQLDSINSLVTLITQLAKPSLWGGEFGQTMALKSYMLLFANCSATTTNLLSKAFLLASMDYTVNNAIVNSSSKGKLEKIRTNYLIGCPPGDSPEEYVKKFIATCISETPEKGPQSRQQLFQFVKPVDVFNKTRDCLAEVRTDAHINARY